MMPPNFTQRLQTFAEVIVRVGLNLQRGQRLLIAEPYELQGVARTAEGIVQAIQRAANCPVEVIWGDGARLREFAARRDFYGFAQLTSAHAAKMEATVRQGDALLFLLGSQPELMRGLPTADVAEIRRIGSENFGPIAQKLARPATNWTAAPAPSPEWARSVYPTLPEASRLGALWEAVFTALRVDLPAPIETWFTHLEELRRLRDSLAERRPTKLHYRGPGTDLTVELPPEHVWCTAQLRTRFGHTFVANLPTEEVFTVPHRDSATGRVRVSRPVHYAGSLIENIELEFSRGRVVRAEAAAGRELLASLLATDEGASRLGEVAFVPGPAPLAAFPRSFHHPLLDENAASHIALGEAYPFCLRSPNPTAFNRSLIHVDLPLDATVSWEPN